ncbi:hypothetical protein NDN08_003560 [Rhodosorus marinus]|uniref:Store-operated calcium entry-associated regulatory factor n=1 Tax=Rhodosorus marinus TaxID=101924 RepID=A0AAV8UZQ2_9RHOD|nr:hypothetical protein NDN08_003560 [Rhodosorus marinus]
MLLLCILTVSSLCRADDPQRVLIDSISALSFAEGLYTKGRRERPRPQLECVGGSAEKGGEHPHLVRCVNRGRPSSGRDIQWECEALMDKNVYIDYIVVHCEGFSGPTDKFIVRDSCYLEYKLEFGQGRSAGGMTTVDSREQRHKGNSEHFFMTRVLLPLGLVVAIACLFNVRRFVSGSRQRAAVPVI